MTRLDSISRALWLRALALAPPVAGAQGWIEPTPRPGIVRPPDWGVQRIATAIRATVEGRVARIEVEEQFRNVGSGIAEATYHYPLAGDAVFQWLSLWMGATTACRWTAATTAR